MLRRSRETRQRYLDAMGITLWVRPSVREHQPESEPNPTSTRSQKTVPNVSAATELIPNSDSTSGVPTERSADTSAPFSSPETETLESIHPVPAASTGGIPITRHGGVEFIQQWWAANGWLVVDTRPATISQSDQQHCDRLIGYLGLYLTGQARPEIVHYIDWPLFENPAIKHDLDEARVYLQQKWESVARRMPLEGVLMLGEWSEQLLSSGLADHENKERLQLLRGPSMARMLEDVSAKRALWHELGSR